ncbi:MAG: extracellular solute-binding protein [Patescibacteria group bacterium]
MPRSNIFQTIVLVLFIGALVIAVLLFAGVIPGFRDTIGGKGGEIVIWGTAPSVSIETILDRVNGEYRNAFIFAYEAQNPDTYEQDLIEALAAGKGPDLFIMPQDFVVRHEDKIFAIPFDMLSERAFKDTFIQEGELYLSQNGIIALPLVVDPMIMYWNRNIFSQGGFPKPPSYWDEMLTLAPALSVRDSNKNIITSAIAFGEFANIVHAKDILSLLFLQAGEEVISRTQEGFSVTFGQRDATNQSPAESVVRFYTEFSDAAKTTYSWNRSLPSSRDMFVKEDLALYFGYGSERADIMAKNPHLNFDIAPVPQIRGNKTQVTFGRMQGIAIARNAKLVAEKDPEKIQIIVSAASALTDSSVAEAFGENISLAPARRDLLSKSKPDAVLPVVYQSALMARGWLDPNADRTYTIFKDMIENISSGRLSIGSAVVSAGEQVAAEVRQ